MTKNRLREEALLYHSRFRKGKIEVIPSKPVATQRDLSLAYSPGVAEPCIEISKNKFEVYNYTAKGNLVAVISNGTAVLGLGDIGPEASKPVMEGKGVLFKKFADIDVFDIEVDTKDIDEFINVVKAIAPTFGGINLEDIKSPECFEIERRLKLELNIPVMHDDQHGTAIISSAALLNALLIVNKKIDEVKLVMSGAGAAATACLNLYCKLGLKPENIIVFDKDGVLNENRSDIQEVHKRFVTKDKSIKNLADAMNGADVFVGLSVGGIVSQDMVRSMAKNPIVFALANPDSEISYEDAMNARNDVITATGRSDTNNQVNNVLGFPYIFRGALDVRAKEINEEMKLAAVYAIAELAQKPVPESVVLAYGEKHINFGKDYLIPKPIDDRLITSISIAVARAAMESGVARNPISDWRHYEEELLTRMGLNNNLIRTITEKAKKQLKRVVFAEADHDKILKAAQIVKDEKIAIPILLGNVDKIKARIKEFDLDLEDVVIIDPRKADVNTNGFSEALWKKRRRKGLSLLDCEKMLHERNYYGCMMVDRGEADALISGLTRNFPSTVKPAIEVVGLSDATKRLAGMYILVTKKGPLFFADTTINQNPTAEDLVDITLLAAEAVRNMNITPRVALLSYSNFGSNRSPEVLEIARAVSLLKEKHSDLIVDGEVQANFAVRPDLLQEMFSFSELAKEGANILIFPNLAAGNIAYKLIQEIAGTDTIGPILLGLKKSIHILQLGCSIREIVNMTSYAAMDANSRYLTEFLINHY